MNKLNDLEGELLLTNPMKEWQAAGFFMFNVFFNSNVFFDDSWMFVDELSDFIHCFGQLDATLQLTCWLQQDLLKTFFTHSTVLVLAQNITV
jgi:hypothetical protein